MKRPRESARGGRGQSLRDAKPTMIAAIPASCTLPEDGDPSKSQVSDVKRFSK